MLRLFFVSVVDIRDDVRAVESECLDSFDRKRILVIGNDSFILEPLEPLLDLLELETILRAAEDEQAPTF